MKNLKLMIFVLAMAISTASYASPTDKKPTAKLRGQIVELLGKSVEKIADTNIRATIVFTVNNKSEIVIISVKSKNSRMEALVKSKLNHKKVVLGASKKEKIYHLPLTLINK
ncbi:MAG TPA: hypothetical protein ENK46_13320 [Flavobacteriia bacterium]|nr:hypothetical protein [Flavobacteriia bacterium]